MFPRALVKEGLTLTMPLYVFLPHNQSLILYRKVGDIIGQDNIASLKKIPPEQLLYDNADSEKVYALGGQALSADVKAGNINSESVKSIASGMLETLNETSNLDNCMNRASTLVQTLIKNFNKTASVVSYDQALKIAMCSASDPLTIHHQQVSSLAVLMALTTGDFSMDDISDLAAAGLIHDLGLKEITHSLAESHFKGVREMSAQEKVIYMRHIDLTLELIKKNKIQVTPGIERIIDHHHECWDGMGFKRCVGNKIYRPARVLRLADDLVSVIQGSHYVLGFKSGLEALRKAAGHYDPLLLKILLQQAEQV